MKTLSKYLFLSIFCAALGFLPAYLFHKYEVLTIDERFYWEQWKQNDKGKVGPMIHVIGKAAIDFGTIDPAKTQSRELVLENIGDQELEVWIEPSPDRIVNVDIADKKIKIANRSSFPIAFTVDGTRVNGELNETVIIQSNDCREDQRQLKVTITGSLAQ